MQRTMTKAERTAEIASIAAKMKSERTKVRAIRADVEHLGADIDRALAEFGRELAAIRKGIRRGHSPRTLAEEVEWEREFGPECDVRSPSRAEPRMRVELCKDSARRYGVSNATVKAAFADVWAAR